MAQIIEIKETSDFKMQDLATFFTPVIFNTMRILKKVNPADTYLENYIWKWKSNPYFFDQYHLAWIWASLKQPKKILEIGTRTGISTCQLLSALIDYKDVEVHCFDLFNDGYITPKLVELNLKALNIPTNIVTFHVGDSAQTVPKFLINEEEPQCLTYRLYDWVLVDGSHDRIPARLDLENVSKNIAPEGILVFDDISTAPGECGLIDVWEAFKEAHPNEFDYYEDMSGKGTAWAIRRSLGN